jgi:GntR family transcriptional regulator
MLAREIKAGVLMDGEKLEPERIMAQRLGIAVGTLRKALTVLQEQGMLERVQGSGNYVRNLDSNNNTIYGFFRLELLEGGGLPSATVLAVKRTAGDKDVNFSSAGQYDRVRRLRFLNERAVALEEIWLDANYSETPLTSDALTDSLYNFYKEHLGFWIARVEDSLSVDQAPPWAPQDHGGAWTQACGYVERRSWDQLGNQAEYSRTWFDTEICRYVARWK